MSCLPLYHLQLVCSNHLLHNWYSGRRMSHWTMTFASVTHSGLCRCVCTVLSCLAQVSSVRQLTSNSHCRPRRSWIWASAEPNSQLSQVLPFFQTEFDVSELMGAWLDVSVALVFFYVFKTKKIDHLMLQVTCSPLNYDFTQSYNLFSGL